MALKWVDISEEIESKNGKANPFGWSQYEIWFNGDKIGWLESGVPSDFVDGYKAVIEHGENEDRLRVWKRE